MEGYYVRIEQHDGVAVRASFLIGKAGLVQHQVVNNLSMGSNVDKMIHMVDALQVCEQHGQVCPAGWKSGKTGIQPSSEGVSDYLSSHAQELNLGLIIFL